MSIIPMLNLQVVVPNALKGSLIKKLMYLGCIEINNSSETVSNDNLSGWTLTESHGSSEIQHELNCIQAALALLDRFNISKKSGLFPDLKLTTPSAMDNSPLIETALEKARAINHLKEALDSSRAEEERILTQKLVLLPWRDLDVPLEITATKHVHLIRGMCPSAVDPKILEEKLLEAAPETVLNLIHTDHEQHYLFLIVHHSQTQGVESVLKTFGFSTKHFKEMVGTPSENIKKLAIQNDALIHGRGLIESNIQTLQADRPALEHAYDALTLKAHQENISSHFLKSSRTYYFEGWVPKPKLDAVTRELKALHCAYAFKEPQNHEEPPVAFQHAKLVAPFGFISALYGTPKYDSVIDPTPFMAPFFFIFFGMMMSDAAYGVILTLVAIWILRKVKQVGFVKQLFTLVLYCGISTIIWGALFGSWFGDIVPAVTKMMTGTAVYITPLWFDPLKQPMTMLYFSFALGGLQIIVGLGLAGWRQIKLGHWWNALFDVGFWYMILFGLIMGLFNIPYGFEIALAGTVGVVLTAGRHEKNILKKLITGILSLYAITGYLSDILSYSRLLALGLASGVVASVVNAMGTIGGPSVGGIIALVLIFIFGHVFNLAINLVGAYVHASRLQYVEFFSKFYDGGGKPFNPFQAKTKYVIVTPESQDSK